MKKILFTAALLFGAAATVTAQEHPRELPAKIDTSAAESGNLRWVAPENEVEVEGLQRINPLDVEAERLNRSGKSLEMIGERPPIRRSY